MVERRGRIRRRRWESASRSRTSAYRAPWDDKPIRAELFSLERLEQHARTLAAAQPVARKGRHHETLSHRLIANELALRTAYGDVATAIEEGAAITPAAEWLIDNFHVVEQQIRGIRRDLPPGYYRQLPKLDGGPFVGLPRILGVAWAYVAHTDSLFDPESLKRFVRAYQEVQPLTIGELWAVAITLRFVLVENLRRIADRVVASRQARRTADMLADRLLGVDGPTAQTAEAALARYREVDLPDAFFVELVQRMRDQGASFAPAMDWIEQRLAERALSADLVVREEHQRQVSASITVRNIITSMRLITEIDWSELVEAISLVDDLLSERSRFREMDFPTRNLYRHAIEELARGSGREELEIARAAAIAAEEARPIDPESVEARVADPGHYLIGLARPAFEQAIGFRAPTSAWLGRTYRALGIGGYVGAGATAAIILLSLPLLLIAAHGVAWPWLVALAMLGVVPAIDLGVALVNHVVTRGFRASLLPAMALVEGVPETFRTLVAVPTLLSSREAVDALVERLEVHYLASPSGEVYFALLTDWRDADAEIAPDDAELLRAAQEAISALNRRYAPGVAGDRFYLLHRRRQWSASEERWIGWERKRGKLMELNRLLRGASDTSFLDPPPMPEAVKYVVTLDSDTRLPPETISRLIGKMAHPLNRPKLDPALGRVVEGYGLLQPRVSPSLPIGREGSLFLRVFSRASGIDPYVAAISDVYQDLFGEGSYTGKGIYDVDAFEAALADRVPDGALLSHDLFEGIFARAGLVSDVEVVEDYPARYDIAALRHHRWARGDWQLLPWILGEGPRRNLRTRRRDVPAIGRWKMLDNLRRSSSPPLCTLALMAGWAAPDPAHLAWTLFILATMTVPPLLPVFAELPNRRPGVPLNAHLRAVGGDFAHALVQVGFMVMFLAHQAWLMADAIFRTVIRLTITRRRLLEWTPGDQAMFAPAVSVDQFCRRMAGGLAIGAAATATGLVEGLRAGPLPALFGAVWLASPAIAAWASRSGPVQSRRPLGESGVALFRKVARRTWRYFETFVDEESHDLPPDNFQEAPLEVVARRTSPTNIGLYLLAIVAARDLGWIGQTEAVRRIERTLLTMQNMERVRGHFFNWYDTSDLRPLDPRYVSSVDSGNLAGHLLALAGAVQEWTDASSSDVTRRAGVADTLELARDALQALPFTTDVHAIARQRVVASLEATKHALATADFRQPSDVLAAAEGLIDAARALAIDEGEAAGAELLFWAQAVRRTIDSHRADIAASDMTAQLAAIAQSARSLALGMDFAFLLDRNRLLLSIGYRTADGALDENCYDLLASEARLASFIAIAKGDLPPKHWFRLGRPVTAVAHGAALVSWSGSMFEYLMPSLVMREPAGSLIDQTNRLVVRRQIAYGREVGAPWGISEAAFNVRDVELTYQYSNFGVPGLGLKRGLADNIVVAPYATALAAMVEPLSAIQNFHRLADAGAAGRYGFYEAIDFTAARVPDGERGAVVRAFMAHHQGMTIVALANILEDGRMRARFHADPLVSAAELLLQERVPRDVVRTPPSVAESAVSLRSRAAEGGGWRIGDPWGAVPDTQLLSNGRLTVMLTAAGSGYTQWKDFAVTRWREDPTGDDYGSYFYLRDVESGAIWSVGVQPTGTAPSDYGVIFAEEKAEIARRDRSIGTSLQVVVSPEDDAEGRRLTISNFSARPREIEITSYTELALAPAAADAAHPAFSKLFVETENLPVSGALLATRRRRAPEEPGIWAAQLAVVGGDLAGKREFETDRARFIGRSGDLRAPSALVTGRALAGGVGTVLDPIFALRRRLRIGPGQSARVDFWTLLAETREELHALIDKHHDPAAFERASALAWTQAQVQLHHFRLSRGQAGDYQRLASHLLNAAPTLRAPPDVIRDGAGGQSSLWSLGISGDLPIMLIRVSESHQLDIVREALEAVEYLRLKRLAVDLVILNERSASYVQDLHQQIEGLVRTIQSRPRINEAPPPGHVFILRADLVAEELRARLASVARVVMAGERGRLADQLPEPRPTAPASQPNPTRAQTPTELQIVHPPPGVHYFNGLGGFSEDGREYLITTGPGQVTPAPWINVIANPQFGFQVSNDGGGYTWSVSSRERQLTPWRNDPVGDLCGQALFVKDLQSGELWSPTRHPVRDESAPFTARHGFGYSRFSTTARGLDLELLEFTPLHEPVRVSRLTIRNTASQVRRLSITAYAEWTLGPSRPASAPFVMTALDAETRALFATNRWVEPFAARTAFLDLGGLQQSWTGDRREFIGRNGVLAEPEALTSNRPLSGRVGAGLDPCAALQSTVELAPGASVELVCCLGDADNEAAAQQLVKRCRSMDLDAALVEVEDHWTKTLGRVQVQTPDRSMDLMLNGWLLYQTLACRLWARSGLYQASGAYGFRDQLQDVMALAPFRPELTREHLLRAAARQFPEGDVQHWWLPHTGQGVRTRISDDRLWLPYATAHYLAVTGDSAVLDEQAPFLDGPVLEPDEAESFGQPGVGASVNLYEHCARAIDVSLSTGPHGLPLIGAGDWNDGFNRVGRAGRGESVWLAWFLIDVIGQFAPCAEARGDVERAKAWRAHAMALVRAVEKEAWDGEWYRRGWFDDGTPLGSAANEECRIDSIAQSWAVLAGGGDPSRARQAMAAVERDLIQPDEGLALLFTPPFDRSAEDPGYVKGYPPGLRENGGQYTHAALWTLMALARLGEGDKAAALFWILNPINHARTRTDVHRYKVEPYVAAADVYAAPAHLGRGGWTWYTGSAGWMHRAGLESILGLKLRADGLVLDPCIPKGWPGYTASIRVGRSLYEIQVDNPLGVSTGVGHADLDGVEIRRRPLQIQLQDDGATHRIKVTLGPRPDSMAEDPRHAAQ